jgi:sarcosine oxidase delta subunit
MTNRTTIALLIEKYSLTRADANAGVAEDLICPMCGHREWFNVARIGLMAKLFRNGVADDYHFAALEPDDPCDCPMCEHEGTVAEFTVTGLDATLRESPPPTH